MATSSDEFPCGISIASINFLQMYDIVSVSPSVRVPDFTFSSRHNSTFPHYRPQRKSGELSRILRLCRPNSPRIEPYPSVVSSKYKVSIITIRVLPKKSGHKIHIFLNESVPASRSVNGIQGCIRQKAVLYQEVNKFSRE